MCAGLRTERRPCGIRVGQLLDAELPLAVVTETTRLQDRRSTDGRQRPIQIGACVDGLEGRCLQAAFAEQGFFRQAILRHRQRTRVGEYRNTLRQPVRGLGRHILEVEGHHIDLGREFFQRRVVGPVRQPQGRDLAGTGIGGAIHDKRVDAKRCGGEGKHPGQLAAAQNAQNGLTALGHERGSGLSRTVCVCLAR